MQFDILPQEPFLNGKPYNIEDCYSEQAGLFNNRLHFHPFHEMSIIYEGCSDFLINGNVYTLGDHSIQLIRPSDYHRQQTGAGQHIRYYNIIFMPEFLTKQMQDVLGRTEGVLCANLSETDWCSCIRLARAVHRAFSEQQKDDLTEVFLRCNIENLCILLLHCCQGTPVPCSDISSEAIRRAVLFIHSQYREQITLAQAAEHAGLSASYFSGIFHKAMGVTFARYLLDYRLMIAERYLRQADLSVKQIASACGFRSCAHFNVAFKQRFGCAPGAWRDRNIHGAPVRGS